jgi:hypothetical protein
MLITFPHASGSSGAQSPLANKCPVAFQEPASSLSRGTELSEEVSGSTGEGDWLGWSGEVALCGDFMTVEGNCPSLSSLSAGSGVARTVIVELPLDSLTDFVTRPAFRLFEGVDDSTRSSH